MEHRITRIETIVETIGDKIGTMEEMLSRHEIACEVNIPKAQEAHEGVVKMSVDLSIITEGMKTVVKSIDDLHNRNKEADEVSRKILEELAELRGEKRFGKWVARGLVAGAISFVLWTANELQDRKIYEERQKSRQEAIVHSHKHSKIKQSKKEK